MYGSLQEGAKANVPIVSNRILKFFNYLVLQTPCQAFG
jgi:hypothetical protein